MIETHLNLFDVVVISVLALSSLFAFFRGFVREMLSLGAWIGAAVVTMYYFPDVALKLKPHFKNAIAASGIGTLAIYTVALIGFSLMNSIILRYIKKGTEVGMLDNFLGFMFGLARGAFMVSLGYFVMTIAMPEDQYPPWLKKSLTRPYAEVGAIRLARVAPEYLSEISTLRKKIKKEQSGVEDGNDDFEMLREKQEDKEKAEGYTKKSSNQLERLLGGAEDE